MAIGGAALLNGSLPAAARQARSFGQLRLRAPRDMVSGGAALLILVAVSLLPPALAAARDVRVRVLESCHPAILELSSPGGLMAVSWPMGEECRVPAGESLALSCRREDGICLERGNVRACRPAWKLGPAADGVLALSAPGCPDRSYFGEMEVSAEAGECRLINRVPLERYAESVTCSEMESAPVEARRALSVAVRSWTVSELGRHGGYDFCDLTHCQLYRGAGACGASGAAGLAAASGLVLLKKGRPIRAWYFSTCGGHTASAADIWGGGGDEVIGRPDGEPAYCRHAEDFRWRFEIERAAFCRAIAKLGVLRQAPRPEECLVEVLERGAGGWVRKMRLSAGGEPVEMSGEQLRLLAGRLFGWKSLRSAWFEVETRRERLVFSGRGRGHGVGLCLQGAIGMADQGKSFRQILEHYFPGAEIAPL